MARVVVYRRADGMTCICRPAWNDRGLARELQTDDEFLDFVIAKSVPADATDVRVVDEAEVPPPCIFRDALTPNLTFDVDRARSILRERIGNDPRIETAATIDHLREIIK